MTGSTASTGLGLLSAASWGGSDFVGGMGSRRASPLLITAAGQVASLLVLGPLCFGYRTALPGSHATVLAAVAGFEVALSLALFYRALSMSAMGLTAALTGLTTAFVPVVFAAVHSGLPGPVTLAGLLIGCAAIWLITHQRASGAVRPAALLLGVLAGLGFGTQLVLFKLAESAIPGGSYGVQGPLIILAIARAAGVCAFLLILPFARPGACGARFLVPGIVAGLLDTLGNLFYLGAVRHGRLDAAAVICSLYPAGTILLSALVLRERPSRRQLAGMALALGAVALLSF